MIYERILNFPATTIQNIKISALTRTTHTSSIWGSKGVVGVSTPTNKEKLTTFTSIRN